MSDWQPIESAPRDGTEILIYAWPDMAVAFADTENECAWTLTDGHDMLGARRHLQSPSHWMPLPTPPKDAQ